MSIDEMFFTDRLEEALLLNFIERMCQVYVFLYNKDKLRSKVYLSFKCSIDVTFDLLRD